MKFLFDVLMIFRGGLVFSIIVLGFPILFFGYVNFFNEPTRVLFFLVSIFFSFFIRFYMHKNWITKSEETPGSLHTGNKVLPMLYLILILAPLEDSLDRSVLFDLEAMRYVGLLFITTGVTILMQVKSSRKVSSENKKFIIWWPFDLAIMMQAIGLVLVFDSTLALFLFLMLIVQIFYRLYKFEHSLKKDPIKWKTYRTIKKRFIPSIF